MEQTTTPTLEQLAAALKIGRGALYALDRELRFTPEWRWRHRRELARSRDLIADDVRRLEHEIVTRSTHG